MNMADDVKLMKQKLKCEDAQYCTQTWEVLWRDNSTPLGPKVTLSRLQVADLEPKQIDLAKKAADFKSTYYMSKAANNNRQS